MLNIAASDQRQLIVSYATLVLRTSNFRVRKAYGSGSGRRRSSTKPGCSKTRHDLSKIKWGSTPFIYVVPIERKGVVSGPPCRLVRPLCPDVLHPRSG